MKSCHIRSMMLLSCILMAAGISSAQPKDAGATFAFNGTALSYEYMLDEDTFVEMAAKVELSEVFLNTTDYPGFSLAVTWNHIIHTWKSRNANDIFLFAGPGIAAGTARDFTKPSGYFLGIKGRFGAECLFHERNVSISVCLAPVIGTHLVILEDSLRMSFYNIGLLNAFVPEVGIKYMF